MANSSMNKAPEFEKFAVGQPVSRLEDPMLLRGDGIYTDDVGLDGQAYAYVFGRRMRTARFNGRIASDERAWRSYGPYGGRYGRRRRKPTVLSIR